MADYLLARGPAPIRLIREGRATSTDENLRFSRELLAQQGVPATEPVIVVTSDFHLMRAERIAQNGLHAGGGRGRADAAIPAL